MSKRKSSKKHPRPSTRSRVAADTRKRRDPREAPPVKSATRRGPSKAAIRETIESVAIAFVLAFLFRTFEAEAFVIPTGSMATTLMGRHKDVVCPVCGSKFEVSAVKEVDRDTSVSLGRAARIVNAMCPMCRYTMDLDHDHPKGKRYRPSKGDRILVNKFAYEFSEPQRWDIAVFKFPGKATNNYIKRLVGLPNETLRISHGDVFFKPRGEDDFTIARKASPKKLLAMLLPVFDNDVTPEVRKHGWLPRWRPEADADAAGAWRPSDEFTAFETSGEASGEVWLRYEHRVPSQRQWFELTEGNLPPGEPQPQLISDFSAYNTCRAWSEPAYDADAFGVHWVGDLALKCTLRPTTDSGEAVFELVEGGRRFRCRIDVATGKATLGISGLDAYHPTATTGVRGGGKHKIIFANIDDQLRLWVGRREVEFDAPTTYDPLDNTRPTKADLAPVGIAANGAGLHVSKLKIFRDIYYIAQREQHSLIADFERGNLTTAEDAHEVLSEPKHWRLFFGDVNMREVTFELHSDQFLALGDNSAKSQDGRLWRTPIANEFYVDRDLLIGKAMFIYWPDTPYKIHLSRFSLPFFPNFPEMGFVR